MQEQWQDCGFTYIDLKSSGVLPSNWTDQVRKAAVELAVRVYLDGCDEDCREPMGTQGCEYSVVTGDKIASRLPWLYRVYELTLATAVSQIAGKELVPCANVRAGVNINMLKGVGARYEWHVDPNPITGILFVTSHSRERGGALVLNKDGRNIQVQPEEGFFFVFKGRELPHCVQPLAGDEVRLSMPMIYYDADERQEFPRELEEYLYGPTSDT